MNRRHSGGLPGQAPTVAKPMDAGWDPTEPTALPASCRPPRKNNTNRPSRERTTLLRLTLPLVLSSHTRTVAYLGNQGSQTAAVSRVDLTAARKRPIIRFPITIMKDSNPPATKADIKKLLDEFGKVNERIDGLDKGLNKRLDEFRGEMNGRLDEFRGEMNRRLDEIDHQLRVLIEQTHFNLAEASHDAEEVLKDKYVGLEKRVKRVENAVGLAAA
jgi:hypothetical protein